MERAKHYEEQVDDDEEADRELNEYEQGLLNKFEENDQEIDKMLDEFLEIAKKLKLHAEGISDEIGRQQHIIKQLNSKAEKARKNLEKRNSALQGVLEKYRSSNKCCVDIVLLLVFLVLIGLMVGILKKKGYM
mmetsp:Transcript_17253/g.16458  ORF Transcript_17253/g.16458 Transcript_17253/m.16458 type:complete len:133 (+) Transcript_17253:620-1018(+)